jgi:tetratricopeptide (TPR) repeat protein
LEQAVRILRSAGPEFRADLASNLSKLGSVYAQLADYPIAMPMLEEAVATATPLGDHNPVLADSLVRLASLLLDQGMAERAEPLLRKAVAILEKTGDIKGMRGSGALTKFGFLRYRQRNYPAAAQYFRQALDNLKKTFGPDHVSVAGAEINLATACLHLEKFEEAGELLRQSYEIEKTAYGESRMLARWLCVQAQLQSKLGHRNEAEARFRQAIAMFEKTAGPDHPSTAEALMVYADFLRPDRKQEAASLQRRAAAILSLR